MDNPARLSDLVSRGYTGSSPIGQTRLGEAWRALLLEVPSIPVSVTSGLLDNASVADVVAAATMRVLRNPDGLKDSSNAIDDWREAQTYSDVTQDVYFTAAELRRMRAITVPTSGSIKYC